MTKPSVRRSAPAPGSQPESPVTQTAVSRIQGAVAIKTGGSVPKGSYIDRMQQAIAKKQE
ncbi:hypothetical protein SR914_12865 [Comamonas testosteroni]|jgi:hypothetical protein|uniref:Uncharacterized protein n=1 Tax=Comamonas testosteroni (strain DSM 14576 / KF-1) TaxID=399795 RepID=B7WWF6_COMTK|nr:hypothetical protein [Comamonas testosteroni]EED65859.1 hypothetical protein CtesDRAFT_PD0805 [Comamonas testosteroni KF-1]MPT39606.1 hypothetical protein [Achromobacter sp.]WQG69250.1 hypothetical protein SR914_12865 [Comamonas testosteroni]